MGRKGPHVTCVVLNYGDYGDWYWDLNLSDEENEANRPNAPFCLVAEGIRYGASIPMMKANVTSNNSGWGNIRGYTRNLLIKSNKYYSLPVGYGFTIWIDIDEATGEYYVNTAFGPYS